MARERRLQGIAALSAGALASVGMATPVTAADAPTDDGPMAEAGEGIPADVLGKWEAERGIDLPDALLIKVEDPGPVPGSGDAFIKWTYRPGSESTEAALIKWVFAPDAAADDALAKVELGLDDPDAQAALRDLGEAFLKYDAGAAGFLKLGDAVPWDEALTRIDDAFLELGGPTIAEEPGDPFQKWHLAVDAEPLEDAFYKLEVVADDSGAAVFHTYRYDAIEVIEDALEDAIEASIEGDPDRPIAAVLDDLRALAAGGARSNPFVDRDRAMKGLPLPKKLPKDAGTYATPKAGIWRSVNLPGTVKCGGATQRIPRSVVEKVKLELEDGGARIVGRDLGERGSKVSLAADPKVQGRYTGTVDLKSDGGRVDMDLTVQLITDEHAVGTAQVKVKVGGRTCSITRRFDMTFKRP